MLKITDVFCVLGLIVNVAGHASAQTVLPDGIYLKAMDGHVVRDANSGLWLFTVQGGSQVSETEGRATGVRNNTVTIAKGIRLALLPNARLQALIEELTEHPDATYRLWSIVSEYRGKNYLWILNYLQLTQRPETDVTQAEGSSETQGSTESSDTSDNRLEIPASVKRTLARQPEVRPSPRADSHELAASQILINRVGYVGSGDNNKMFVFDGFSLTTHEPSVRLLPSRALEQMEREQARSMAQYRFSIAGLTSTYEGKTYLLVQRAYRIYSYGNFTP